jgi:DNA-binding NarL/FixJ family response regulator
VDGYEAIRLIKGAWPACRMIALSIHEGPAEQDKARRAGADDFIAKGEPLHSLMDSIHKISKGDRT